MRLQETKGRFHISLPKKDVKKLGWKRGMDLYVGLLGYGEKKLIVEEIKEEQ